MTTSNNEWQRVVQQVIKSDNEWQQILHNNIFSDMEGHKKTALNFLLLTLNINSEVDDVLQCLSSSEKVTYK